MLNFLEKFKEAKPTEVSSDEKNVLTTAILIECAKEDGDFSDVEIRKIKKLLENKLGVNSEKVSSVFDQAIELCQDSVEIYSLTKDIRDNFSHEEILDILELMWTIMLADGKIDDFEDAMMRKIVGLFHLTGKDSSEARHKASININNQS
tara:strand:+ start:27 stop:476 length:450 start_codon:yes stop_codon:yes gene_type:complete